MPRQEHQDNCGSAQTMPHNLDAEVGFLGSVFVEAIRDDSELLDQAIGMNVTAKWFFASSHGIIWNAIYSVYQANIPPELSAVLEYLNSTDQMEYVGGYHALLEIENRVETSTWGKQFLKTIKVLYQRRMLIKACEVALKTAYEPLSVDVNMLSEEFDPDAEIFNQLETACSLVRDTCAGQVLAASENVQEAFEDIERSRLFNGAPTGQRTGINLLDSTTTGFHPGEMIILAARPSIGKSALAGAFAQFAVFPPKLTIASGAERVGALVFSYEMTKKEYLKRMLSSIGRFDLREVHNLTDQDLDRIKDLTLRFKNSPLFIENDSSLDVSQIAAKARQVNRRCQKEYGCRLGLIVVDYVQLMPSHTRSRSRDEAVGINSRGLKQLAMKLEVPVVVLSQLNRELEKEKRFPRLSDLRESGSLEQDADIVLLLGPQNPRQENFLQRKERPLKLQIAKQRNGPLKDIFLNFIATELRVTDDL